ncbi:MAG: PorT family protein [Winogradskyella sp.]|uniref:porin family protein n=1 Tax=Winogradskyella sp. TaxID=1883156 RepID=UPI0025EF81FB|nr:porin family protein [Winogradskyella sp.]NRB82656.1 PorT family protein [Winogradskyella sp.]
MKYFLIPVFIVFLSINAFAQDNDNPLDNSFTFGLRTGYNTFALSADNLTPYTSGYYGGFFFEKKLSEIWALQFETNFNYNGSSTLQFPLLLKYKIAEKFQLFGGPQLSYSFEQKNIDKANRNKRFGMSLILGMQYDISKKWFVEARYTHGLTDQFSVFQGLNVDPVFAKQRSFSLGIGYKF